MTREEATRILDQETTRDALWEYDTAKERFAAVNEAMRLGAEALRGALTTMEGTYVSMAWFEAETRRLKAELRKAREEPLAPNDPLTLEELREMDGEPVWVVPENEKYPSKWMLVYTETEVCCSSDRSMAMFKTLGKTWLAYRRKPEKMH